MNYFKKFPIRWQFSFIALSIVIIMVFIILSSYFKTASVIEKKNSEYFDEMISQINGTVESNCDVYNHLVENISYSKTVQDYLNETDPTKKFAEYAQVKDFITNLAGLKDGILDIALFSNNGTFFNINGDIQNVQKYKNEIPDNKLYYYTSRKTINFPDHDKNCIIAGARIYSTQNYTKGNNELGVVMIVIDANTLPSYKKEVTTKNKTVLYMTDREGKVFFSNNPTIKIGSLLNKNLSSMISNKNNTISINGVRYNIRIGDIPDIGGRIVLEIPQDELLSELDDIRRQQLFSFFIALFLLAGPFSYVINNIVQPLNKFMGFMNEIKSGKLKSLKKRINLSGNAEIITMANEFNNLLDETDDLTHRLIESNSRLYEMELAKRQSELDYLRSQINPHFLYNTLESIKGAAVEEGSDKIFDMAKALGQVFKYSIKGTDVVELREELNIIKSYLTIQKIRFGNRLNIEYSFEENVLRCKIPKMILQPIIENAVSHGIEPKIGEGHLWIGGCIERDRLTIHIKDDGVGMDEESLMNLRFNLARYSENIRHRSDLVNSIGLKNVNNRIKLIFGKEFGININSSYGAGTDVILTLPIEEDNYVQGIPG